jgi:hypothetical protein
MLFGLVDSEILLGARRIEKACTIRGGRLMVREFTITRSGQTRRMTR